MDSPTRKDDSEMPLSKAKAKGKGKGKGKAVSDDDDSHGDVKAGVVAGRRRCSRKAGAIVDLVLRLCGSGAAFGASANAGQAEEVLPFFTQFLQFHAEYTDLTSLTFFVVAMAFVGGFMVLALPMSIACIVRPRKRGPRLFLIILDTALMALTFAAAASAAAVMYLAHNGSSEANWPAICQQFTDFCQQITGAVVASLVTGVFLIVLAANSVIALKATSR